jgi:hypothetical protein
MALPPSPDGEGYILVGQTTPPFRRLHGASPGGEAYNMVKVICNYVITFPLNY